MAFNLSATAGGINTDVDSSSAGTLYPIFIDCSHGNPAFGVDMMVDMPSAAAAGQAVAGVSQAQWDASSSISNGSGGATATPYTNAGVPLDVGDQHLVSSQTTSSGEIDDVGTITVLGNDNQGETISFHDSVTSGGLCYSQGTITESAETP